MKYRLELNKAILRLKLGADAHEKVSCRDVPVSLTWEGEVAKGPAIDYSDICMVLKGFEGKDYDYIEDLASDILFLLLRVYTEGHWTVTVNKPYPQVSLKLESASVTVEGGENG
jgi:dihydroneopterin aldolase